MRGMVRNRGAGGQSCDEGPPLAIVEMSAIAVGIRRLTPPG